ncbi:unnamed protein product [Lactuca saligna]|uniref:Uncharacterized protein n=1 Tax=Lactuca saligna TaxID=75948 RepID=A0AA36E604_LACSI|nr:unnamed protein product [Lactuca saligna]
MGSKEVHDIVCLESVVVNLTLDLKVHAFDAIFSLMGIMNSPLDQCFNTNGFLAHNSNHWSWQNQTRQQSGNLHHGQLILGFTLMLS